MQFDGKIFNREEIEKKLDEENELDETKDPTEANEEKENIEE